MTATENPRRPLTIAYSVTNPKGNYFPIPDDPDTTEVEDTFEGSIERTFTRADDTSPWIATIPIQTKNPDEIDRDHGTIRVTLNDSNPAGQYTVADSPNHYGEVTVTDDTVPEISINNALDIYEGQKANFTLVADKQPWQAVTIRFKPENSSGEYLLFGSYSTTDIWTEDVTFGPNDDNSLIIGTLPVPTTTATATSGRITVNLHDDDSSPKDYKYSDTPTRRTATVEVEDFPSPTLSIAPKSNTVAEGTDAVFVITSTDDPVQELRVKYTISQPKGDFIDPARFVGDLDVARYVREEFTQDENRGDDWTIEVTIPIRNIDGDNANGEVKVVLNTPDSGAKYLRDPNINKYEASVTINDTDIPRVSIANAPETVEGQYAEFELTSHIEPHKAIDIHFTPRASTGNFLDLTGGLDNRPRTTTEPLTFRSEGAGKPYKAILQVLTTDDENLTNGEISVILLDDQKSKRLYTYWE